MNSAIQKEQTTLKSHRFAFALATGLGAGFTPIAPGTMGAVEGVAIFLAISALNFGQSSRALVFLTLNVVLFVVGVWASNKACARTRLEDPRLIVIDEVSGQLIALTPLAFWASIPVVAVVIGFLLFRLFDIFKPYPIRRLETLPGGLGVMADDALAGVYAAALIWMGSLLHLY